jgi:S-methylmethionine-dependent homocysteine/selenocysteine methylase
MTIRERLLKPDPVLMDGAVGTELARRGIDTTLPLWSARALIDDRGCETLRSLHADYARAGAEILITNTFRSTQRALGRAGLGDRWHLLNRRAVDAARAGAEAAGDAGAGASVVLVAGSVAPLEDCYRPDEVPAQDDCRQEHRRQVDLLARLGVDLVVIETMNLGREAVAAAEAARAVGIDALVSFCPGSPGKLLSGESLSDVLTRVLRAGGDRILGCLLNCGSPDLLAAAYPDFAGLRPEIPHGLYAHLGEPDPVIGWRLPRDQDPDGYAAWMAARVSEGALLVGGCCGTGPAHIAALASRLSRR